MASATTNKTKNNKTQRMERDLMTRKDRYGVEMRERVMWDIREGVVGSDTFVPKHIAITTWKNMSFAGGIDNSLFKVKETFFLRFIFISVDAME